MSEATALNSLCGFLSEKLSGIYYVGEISIIFSQHKHKTEMNESKREKTILVSVFLNL